jgi:hypothetical protein
MLPTAVLATRHQRIRMFLPRRHQDRLASLVEQLKHAKAPKLNAILAACMKLFPKASAEEIAVIGFFVIAEANLRALLNQIAANQSGATQAGFNWASINHPHWATGYSYTPAPVPIGGSGASTTAAVNASAVQSGLQNAGAERVAERIGLRQRPQRDGKRDVANAHGCPVKVVADGFRYRERYRQHGYGDRRKYKVLTGGTRGGIGRTRTLEDRPASGHRPTRSREPADPLRVPRLLKRHGAANGDGMIRIVCPQRWREEVGDGAARDVDFEIDEPRTDAVLPCRRGLPVGLARVVEVRFVR